MTIRWKENLELPPLRVIGRDPKWPSVPWLFCKPVSQPPPEYEDIYLGWFLADDLVADGGLQELKQAAAEAPVRQFAGPQLNGR